MAEQSLNYNEKMTPLFGWSSVSVQIKDSAIVSAIVYCLSLGRRHLVNAYEVEAGIAVIAGNTVWSMPERLECEVLQKRAI